MPAEGDYAFVETDYWLKHANAPNLNEFLWAFGAEGYYGDAGALTNYERISSISETFSTTWLWMVPTMFTSEALGT